MGVVNNSKRRRPFSTSSFICLPVCLYHFICISVLCVCVFVPAQSSSPVSVYPSLSIYTHKPPSGIASQPHTHTHPYQHQPVHSQTVLAKRINYVQMLWIVGKDLRGKLYRVGVAICLKAYEGRQMEGAGAQFVAVNLPGLLYESISISKFRLKQNPLRFSVPAKVVT